MTKRQIEKEVRRWQKLLRLQDWKIVAEVSNSETLSNGETYGEITFNRNKLSATIKAATAREEHDVMRTVCHEVCHLLLDGPWAEHLTALEGLGREARQMSQDRYREQEEQIIERLVDILCNTGEEAKVK